MKRTTLIAAAAMCAITLGTIVSDVRADISNSAVLFLRIAPNARAAAMGDAYVAIADDANATHWNPAGLASASLQGSWKSTKVPAELQPVKGIAALRKGGGTLDGYELWAITAKGLARFGKTWETGETFNMRTDETVAGKVGAFFNLTDPAEIRSAVRNVAAANNKESFESLQALLDSVRSSVPASYAHQAEIAAGLDSLANSYDECRINWIRIDELRKQLDEGNKDGSLSEGELDKIGFSIEKAQARFVPEQVVIPYAAITTSELTSIEADLQSMLVGTKNGLLKYNGRNWQRYSKQDGLKSDAILGLKYIGNVIYITTDSGLSRWGGLTIDTLSSKSPLPEGPIDAIGGASATDFFVSVKGELYHYDGTTWSTTRPYTVVVGDTPERLAERNSIYKTEADLKYYQAKMEASGLPAIAPQGDSAQPTAAGSASPGAIIQLPYVGQILGRVTAISVGPSNQLLLGTDLGLAMQSDSGWVLPGYARTTVSDSAAIHSFIPSSASTEELRTAALARFRAINGLGETDMPQPGSTILAAENKLSGQIYQIERNEEVIYVSSGLGQAAYRNGTWADAKLGGMENPESVSIVRSADKTWFANEGTIANRTSGGASLAFTYVKWLPELAPDLYYSFLGAAKDVGFGTVGANITFISYGTITRTREESATPVGTFESYDIAGTLAWGVALSPKTRIGIAAKVIHSRLSDQGAGQEQGQGTSTGFAFDLGLLQSLSSKLQLGMAVTNLGPQMAYIDAAQADELPRNLAIGFAYKLIDAEDTRFLITGEMNKILVGLDDGFSTELKEAIFNGGAEFEFLDLIAFRGGYIYDEDGKVKTPTFGVGLRPIKPVRFDVSYIPSSSDVALANTLRWSLAFNL